MRPFDLATIADGLPAAPLVDQLNALGWPPRAVVHAPPGSGKTTVVPPALANLAAEAAAGNAKPTATRVRRQRAGRVLVTQPRRIAARAAATRLSQLSGTQLGDTAGFTIRGQRTVTDHTRVEFVTTGVLLNRLMRDPELPGVAAVILDEVHERSVDSDLAFGMLRQLAELRDDLGLIVMSATLDTVRWTTLLGSAEAAPLLSVDSRPHPLAELWETPDTRPLDDRGVTPGFLAHVAHTVTEALDGEKLVAGPDSAGAPPPSGGILVFLPGRREIDRVAGLVNDRLRHDFPSGTAEVLTLTGSTPPRAQDAVLTGRLDGPSPRRIVLATNVAESALTVPGVDLVVDAGLDRQQRLDTVRGMSGLVTVGASKAAMIQRAGRAARLGPGTVIRVMSQADFASRPGSTPPEILTSDLTQPALQLACWGSPGGTDLALPDTPPPRALDAATATLRALGAVAADGTITATGRRLARIPADPRLARALLDGAALVGNNRAAEAVATLASDVRAPGGDLGGLLRQVRRDGHSRWRSDVRRFASELEPAETSGHTDGSYGSSGASPEDLALVTALAFPDRIARLRSGSQDEYLLAGGTGGQLPRESALKGHEWLAVSEIGLSAGRPLIRAAVALTFDQAELAGAEMLDSRVTATFSGGKVRARRVERLGAIELSSTPCTPTEEASRAAVAEALSSHGLLQFLQIDEGRQGERPRTDSRDFAFAQLRGRLGLLHAVYGDPWPDVSLQALAQSAADWLGPELDRIANGTNPAKVDPVAALRRVLPWPEATHLNELVPDRIHVPSGSGVRLDYPSPEDHAPGDNAAPVLAVKLQECFGWTAGPGVCQGRVPVLLHLLSPARRPLAVTADLASFWHSAYPAVRAENRGKYHKHPWPEDPWNAPATAKTKTQPKAKG